MRKSKRQSGSVDDVIDELDADAKEHARQRRIEHSSRGLPRHDDSIDGASVNGWLGDDSHRRQSDKPRSADSRRVIGTSPHRRHLRHQHEGTFATASGRTDTRLMTVNSRELLAAQNDVPLRMTSRAYGFGDVSSEQPEAAAAEEADGHRSSYVEQTDSVYDLALIAEESDTRLGISATSSSDLYNNNVVVGRFNVRRDSLDKFRRRRRSDALLNEIQTAIDASSSINIHYVDENHAGDRFDGYDDGLRMSVSRRSRNGGRGGWTSASPGVPSGPPIVFNPPHGDWQRLNADQLLDVPVVREHPGIWDGIEPRIFSPNTPPRRFKRVAGDGNCLFRSLSYWITGSEEFHSQVRQAIVNELSINASRYAAVTEDHGIAATDYVRESEMSYEGVWGSDVEIFVAATLLQTPIAVYAAFGDRQHLWQVFEPINDVNNNGQIESGLPPEVAAGNTMVPSAPGQGFMLYLRNSNSHFEPVVDV